MTVLVCTPQAVNLRDRLVLVPETDECLLQLVGILVLGCRKVEGEEIRLELKAPGDGIHDE